MAKHEAAQRRLSHVIQRALQRYQISIPAAEIDNIPGEYQIGNDGRFLTNFFGTLIVVAKNEERTVTVLPLDCLATAEIDRVPQEMLLQALKQKRGWRSQKHRNDLHRRIWEG